MKPVCLDFVLLSLSTLLTFENALICGFDFGFYHFCFLKKLFNSVFIHSIIKNKEEKEDEIFCKHFLNIFVNTWLW